MRQLALLLAVLPLAARADAPAPLAPCGECHMIFPAQMLPQRSWRAILGGLADHFGENAEIDAKDRAAILAYLLDHAADSPNASARDRHYLAALATDETPLRITATGWWRQMHADYASEAKKHEQVKSPADCMACHPDGVH